LFARPAQRENAANGQKGIEVAKMRGFQRFAATFEQA
jgi:hypothetical protein